MREIYGLDPAPERWWEVLGACTTDGVDLEPFVTPGREAEAVAVCAGCLVRSECKAYADANDERFGVWGGEYRGAWPV